MRFSCFLKIVARIETGTDCVQIRFVGLVQYTRLLASNTLPANGSYIGDGAGGLSTGVVAGGPLKPFDGLDIAIKLSDWHKRCKNKRSSQYLFDDPKFKLKYSLTLKLVGCALYR